VRYHPAIIAQAAATLAIISDGRFTLGAGAGERLNEHVTGTGFPGRRVRHERLREALEIIRLLWQGGYQSYEGKHLQLEDARVFDLPAQPPPIAVAAGGPEATTIAADLDDALFATEPDGDLITTWRELGGHGSAYGEMPLAWAHDEEDAIQAVLDTSAFALTGWKVMAELPNPVNFQAAVASIGPQQVKDQFACGPDPRRHLQVAQQYADAGFDHLVTMNCGPDPDGFMDFFARELAAPLRALTPSGSRAA
jgi:G6PDH family F420-dependent oxidoreductase